MPYVGGASLQKRLDNEGALPIADILRIGIQISAGLAAAHEQGLVHRDIKPANILLDQGVDRLVITDFGLARAVDDASVTRTGVIAGTPQYMSPEQARGEPVDARSDLFSLGSVLYAACTGRVPFRADTPYGVLRRITDNTARPIQEINPQIPAWLCRIIDRLHAKSIAERFQSADEVAQLLTQCLAHFTQPTAHALPSELRESRRNAFKLVALRVGLLSAAFVLVIAFAWWAIRQSTELKQATSTPTPATTFPTNEELAGPWDSAESITDWSDNLTPIIQQIENSLLNNPPAPTPARQLQSHGD
jgi:serine/threonine-protein kinase